jgi:hypothetical protein
VYFPYQQIRPASPIKSSESTGPGKEGAAMESAKLHKSQARAGELVLQTGPKAGTRRPLGAPMTFLGRGPDCDIRLNIDGIDPLHCLLVFGPEGIILRDLNSVGGTYVNGLRTDRQVLEHGDTVTVGPFQFRVELSGCDSAEAAPDVSHESLHIQAAAVTAQQAALDEEEARLQKRKGDLQQQEEQLAAHLADKQRQVQLWSDFTKAERETLRKEKLEQDQRIAALEEELQQARENLARDHQQLTEERQHIARIYQRLRHRWQKQWAAEKEKYRLLNESLAAEREANTLKTEELSNREGALSAGIVRFNAERELALRRLKEERDSLAKDQSTWRQRRSLEIKALHARRRELDATQRKINEGRQLMRDEKEAWEEQQESLQQELHGLNNRVLHQRIRLEEQGAEIARLEQERRRQLPKEDAELPKAIGFAHATPVAAQADERRCDEHRCDEHRCDELERFASALADQRALLVEQYARLADLQDAWQRQRNQAADELETLAARLAGDEERLNERHRQTITVEDRLHERQADLEVARQEIAGWRAQLKVRVESLAEEQEMTRQHLARKKALLEQQLAGLTVLRQRWRRRRDQEIEQLQNDRAALQREHKETQERRVEYFAKSQQLAEDRRVLAEKSLAVEQYRQEVVIRAKDPSAQRRLERLRRRWLTLNGAMIANAKREREAANKELQRLEAVTADLHEKCSFVTIETAALTEKEALVEQLETILKTREQNLELEIRKLESQQQIASMHVNAQIDTLAMAVFAEADVSPIERAA